jgi:hypothetical protein
MEACLSFQFKKIAAVLLLWICLNEKGGGKNPKNEETLIDIIDSSNKPETSLCRI